MSTLERKNAEAVVREFEYGDRKTRERIMNDLIRDLKYGDGNSRIIAVTALMKVQGSKGTFEPLIRALKDEDQGVRIGAAFALMRLGDLRAIDHLIEAMNNDVNDAVRFAASKALEGLELKRNNPEKWEAIWKRLD